MKYYRDIKNVVDTSKEEGKKEKLDETIISLLKDGTLSKQQIANILKVSIEYIETIQKEQ